MASWVSMGMADRSTTVYCLVRSTLVGFESHLSVFLREEVLLYTASMVASDLYFFLSLSQISYRSRTLAVFSVSRLSCLQGRSRTLHRVQRAFRLYMSSVYGSCPLLSAGSGKTSRYSRVHRTSRSDRTVRSH